MTDLSMATSAELVAELGRRLGAAADVDTAAVASADCVRYNPMEDLATNHRGVSLAYRDIAVQGLADVDRGLIVLQRGMPASLHRTVLTHELQHVRLGHRRTRSRGLWEVREIQTSRETAERLVDVEPLREGLALGLPIERIAGELNTTTETVRWRLASVPDAELRGMVSAAE